MCFPWGARGLQQDAFIHAELSGLFGLYSLRERCLILVLKIGTEIKAKGQGGLKVYVGEGEARSRCAVVSVGAGLLNLVPSVPCRAGRPLRNWGGVVSGLPFRLAGLGFVGSRTL